MQKNNFFYSKSDVAKMKQLIRTGESLFKIAREHHQAFNAPLSGFYAKLIKVSKNTKKIAKIEKAMPKKETKGIVIPDGTTFEGTTKKVQIYSDHFRIYF